LIKGRGGGRGRGGDEEMRTGKLGNKKERGGGANEALLS